MNIKEIKKISLIGNNFHREVLQKSKYKHMPAAISINWIDECQVAGEKIFELFVKFARSTKFVLDVRFFADIIFNIFLFREKKCEF